MPRLLWATLATLLSGLRSRRELLIENLTLRQQLTTVLQKRRPIIGSADRVFWVVLRRLWARWSDVVVIVKPEARDRSRLAPCGLRAVLEMLVQIGKIAWRAIGWPTAPRPRSENGEREWMGSSPDPRGVAEFSVSERTVSRHLRQDRRRPEQRQSWLTFLRNHREVLVAMDLFVVPTASFRLLYVWFAIGHSRRKIVHWSVRAGPPARLLAVRSATPTWRLLEPACPSFASLDSGSADARLFQATVS